MPVDEGYRGDEKVNVPNPDPSLLTTQQLRDGMLGLKELIGARLDAMDTATDLRLEMFKGLPDDIERRIAHLREVQDEKFHTIDNQFRERDVRTTQASGAADDALKAALQAAKELVGAQGEASAAAAVKSETSFTKQIDQIGTIIQTLEKALDARITELKERIDRGEGSSSGADQGRADRRLDSQFGVSIFAVLLLLLSVGVSLYVASHR